MQNRAILCLFLLSHLFSAHSQQFTWTTQLTGDAYELGKKSLQDLEGNTYVIGYSSGSSFEYEGVTYPTNGDGDAFFAKFNTNKELVWMKSIGGDDSTYSDAAQDMHIDLFGNIYLIFKASGGNFTYDGQILSGINSDGQIGGEGVLLKVNLNGNYIWHDSGTFSSYFNAITTDVSGNVYLTGSFYSDTILGGAITLSNPSTGTTRDLFLAKYQPDGTILWAKNAGGMPHNTFAYGNDVEINPLTNEVILMGSVQGNVFFDDIPVPLYQGSSNGQVLVSYNMDGTLNWVNRVLDNQNSFWSSAVSLSISNSGILGVCGLTSQGEGLVGFYTSDGAIISEQVYHSSSEIGLHSITFNEFNEAYLSGSCTNDAVIGISPGTVSLSTSTGFIVKMDILQQVKWVMEYSEPTFLSSINYDRGKLLFACRFDGEFTYDEGGNVFIANYGDALFGEIIDYDLPDNRCNITGTIYQDVDANCNLDNNDIVQKSVIVKAVDSNGISHFSISDLSGHYDIPVDIGTYIVEILPNITQSSLTLLTCNTQQEVILTELGQDAENINLSLEIANCPLLTVDLSSDRRRRCFESNTYISYSNLGFAEADNVEITVQFPEYVTFISSDHSYSINSQGNYVFGLGTLAPNQSGFISIVDFTECIDGITGLTQCTEAWITPSNFCAEALDPEYENWDRSSINVEGVCLNDTTVQFTITNIAAFGIGDMQNLHEYRIFIDNGLAETSTFQLNGGESLNIEYPANGQTIRLEADQHPNHPGNSEPQETIEACGSNGGGVSIGFFRTMEMDDKDTDVEIHCLEIIDSYDPNDKLVNPTGVTYNNYIEAGTILEYMIRFQNTGTDTAYTVRVKDSLSAYLNPSTIQWGVSSHPYIINITGTETPVIEFIFNNINLPDSTSNELGSHGFVKFKIATYDALEIGTEINNNANIYFDYNFPILTNTAQTTISDIVLVYEPLNNEVFLEDDVSVYPNPTSGLLVIESNILQKVEIYNSSGLLIETTSKNEVDLSKYAKGIYLVKIITNKGATTKKVILK